MCTPPQSWYEIYTNVFSRQHQNKTGQRHRNYRFAELSTSVSHTLLHCCNAIRMYRDTVDDATNGYAPISQGHLHPSWRRGPANRYQKFQHVFIWTLSCLKSPLAGRCVQQFANFNNKIHVSSVSLSICDTESVLMLSKARVVLNYDG